MAPSSKLIQIINGYDSEVNRIRSAVTGTVETLWNGLPDYRNSNVAGFAKKAASITEGGGIQVQRFTSAYLGALQSAATNQPFRPPALSPRLVTSKALRGVSAVDLFQRPGANVYAALAHGRPFDAAVHSGMARAINLAATHLQLVKTHTAREVFSRDPAVTRYKRVLGGGDTCPLCVAAADGVYNSEDLMPIHPGCTCGVAPVFGRIDPGRSINQKVSSDETVEVAVREHGEMGPLLTRASDDFTTPDDF